MTEVVVVYQIEGVLEGVGGDVFINGAWRASDATARVPLIYPASERQFADVADVTASDVDAAVTAARTAFDEGPWPRMGVDERLDVLRRVSKLLGDRTQEIAELITTEMGSPIAFSLGAQVPVARMILDYYIDLAPSFPFEQRREGRSAPAVVLHDPVGVVGAIAAWNYPLSLLMMKLAPALVAGCTVVAKPAIETALDGLVLARIFEEADLPPGVVNMVPGGPAAGEHLVSHRGIDRVGFTGSSAVGRRIAEICGRDLRRCSLELGGKSAMVILDDVEVDAAIAGARAFAMRNSGQTCSNQTRVLVPRSRQTELTDALCNMVAELRVGDPMDPSTEVGPLVSERQRARVESFIGLGVEEGASVAVGGRRPAALPVGWYIEPTVLVGATNDMRIAREEIFGPVLAVIPYQDDVDAVRIANDSEYGLAASIWSSDTSRAEVVARKLQAGMLIVNGSGGSLDAPYGGFKASGLGREMGPEGLASYLESKSMPLF